MAFVWQGLVNGSATTRRPAMSRRTGTVRCMAAEGPEDYVALGLAVCFREKGRKLEELTVVEPLSCATLENISSLEVPTSYKRVMALKLGEIPEKVDDLPSDFIGEDAPVWADDFAERANAAARTFLRRPESQKLVELGGISDKFQFSTERKRVVNSSWEPSFEDNVKQDKSIDVYNREADELANA